MPGENTTPNTTGGDAGQGAQGAPAAPQTQNPQTPGNTPPNIGLSETEAAARIEKARADEKQKAYAKIDVLSKERQELADRYKRAEEELAAARKNLNELREGKSTEVDSLQKELTQFRERSEKLEKAIETVAAEAAKRIQESEVQAYRERIIREKTIELAELVGGSTKEEVDASVEAAIKREEQLRAKFAGAANANQASTTAPPTTPASAPAQNQVPADTSGLPRPINPDGSQGRDLLKDLSPVNRENLSKLPREEYMKRRDELLKIAKEKSGLL